MPRWLRWDPNEETAVIEDDAGNEITTDLAVEKDGDFYLIGPIDREDM